MRYVIHCQPLGLIHELGGLFAYVTHPAHRLERAVNVAATMAEVMTATLFGGMVFFPSVVAPVVFKVLDAEHARAFLRALFPRYYGFIIVTATFAAILWIPVAWLAAGVLLAVAGATLVVRQRLVPQINAWRDAGLAGDAAAMRRFDSGHKLSVRINIVQMLAVLGVLVVA